MTITHFSIVKENGETPTSITTSTRYNLRLEWDASAYGNTLRAGDYFVVNLPDEFSFPTNHSATHFNLYALDGSVIATAVVNSNGSAGGGTVTVTFTDYVENRYDISGGMSLNFTLVKEKVVTGQENSFSVTIGSETYTYTIDVGESGPGTPVDPSEVLYKRASKSDSTDEYVQWTARINFAGLTLPNAVVSDTIQVGGGEFTSQYIPDSFELEERIFDEYGDKVTTVQKWTAAQLGDRLQFNEDRTTFTLSMENINGQQYYLKYKTTYSPGLTLRNGMSITSGSDVWTSEREYQEASSGGQGGGTLNSKIAILKKDANTGDVLAGAQFKITNTDTGEAFTLTSDASGQAVSDKLVAGTYEVVEIVAPAGYQLNDKVYTVKVSADSTSSIEIADAPETTSFTVDKIWTGPIADGPVTVHLTVDGQVVATGELSADNGWRYVFEGLPKYDDDGTEISYEVEEIDLPGWSASYDYSEEGNSVTITNTNVETIDIPVAKTWVGPAAGPVTITLTADGLPTVNAQLNEANGWQHTFAGLPKHDPVDGHPIEYDVQEAPVSGYDSERSGSVETGFTFTNTSLETADISGSKTWIDGGNQDGVRPASITVRLLADGNEVGSKTVTANDGWSWSFAGMPVYDRGDGHRIVYSVTEDAVEGYSTSYAGFDVTNSHAPGKISVTVAKAWSDENDKDGSRPQSVTVRLLADGADTGKTLVLSPENNWTGSFGELDEYNAGSKVAYTVAEDEVEGYAATITGDAGRGYVIENSHTPAEPPTPTTPPRDRPKSAAPKTGDGLLAGTLALAGIASAAIAVMIAARRRRSRDV